MLMLMTDRDHIKNVNRTNNKNSTQTEEKRFITGKMCILKLKEFFCSSFLQIDNYVNIIFFLFHF